VSDTATVLVGRRGRVGVVTLNRPAKLNALNRQLVEELEAAMRELEADDEIGAIVITGAGDRAFSAGGDMAEQVARIEGAATAAPPPEQGRFRSASAAVRGCRKPVLAAIRGYCYGGGALLAIDCDVRISADDARFKFPGASYGRGPGGATLPRIVGEAKAKELLFTGDEVLAAEALRIGLVNRVVPADEVLEATIAMAARMAANSPQAVALLKETIELAMPIEQALAHEEAGNREIGRSPDSTDRFRRAAERVIGQTR
jgi:enoyl-CoA hydratase